MTLTGLTNVKLKIYEQTSNKLLLTQRIPFVLDDHQFKSTSCLLMSIKKIQFKQKG